MPKNNQRHPFESLDIPVVIFCGGTGSRMREKTMFKPKPMIEVGGRPLLWHIMKIYSHYGFNKFIVTLGYRGDYIQRYFKKDPKRLFANFNVILAETGKDTPTGGRLLRVSRYIKTDTFMCTYGDGVTDLNLKRLLSFHLQSGEMGTLTGVHIPHRFGILECRKDGKLLGYQKNHPMEETVFGGFMVFQKQFLDYLEDSMMIEDPFNGLAKKGKLVVYDHRGYWFGVDTVKDLKTINEDWRFKHPWAVWRK